MIVIASEDIGLASSTLLPLAVATVSLVPEQFGALFERITST